MFAPHNAAKLAALQPPVRQRYGADQLIARNAILAARAQVATEIDIFQAWLSAHGGQQMVGGGQRGGAGCGGPGSLSRNCVRLLVIGALCGGAGFAGKFAYGALSGPGALAAFTTVSGKSSALHLAVAKNYASFIHFIQSELLQGKVPFWGYIVTFFAAKGGAEGLMSLLGTVGGYASSVVERLTDILCGIGPALWPAGAAQPAAAAPVVAAISAALAAPAPVITAAKGAAEAAAARAPAAAQPVVAAAGTAAGSGGSNPPAATAALQAAAAAADGGAKIDATEAAPALTSAAVAIATAGAEEEALAAGASPAQATGVAAAVSQAPATGGAEAGVPPPIAEQAKRTWGEFMSMFIMGGGYRRHRKSGRRKHRKARGRKTRSKNY